MGRIKAFHSYEPGVKDTAGDTCIQQSIWEEESHSTKHGDIPAILIEQCHESETVGGANEEKRDNIITNTYRFVSSAVRSASKLVTF